MAHSRFDFDCRLDVVFDNGFFCVGLHFFNRSDMNEVVHELKIWPQYFQAVVDGRKTFEVRTNDRPFQFGHTVVLKEWDPTREYVDATMRQLKEPNGYTGREATFMIGYIFPIDQERIVFSLIKR